MTIYDFSWSKSEKKVARTAFDTAYQRECSAIIDELRKRVAEIEEPDNIWRLHDYLTKARNGIDEKYDYRYSQLILVFAKLVSEGWLDLDDLEGLSEEKIDRIETVVALCNG